MAGVENQGRAPEPPSVILEGAHERATDPTAACAAVNHDLRHLGPVCGVRARGELQLRRADEPQLAVASGEDDGLLEERFWDRCTLFDVKFAPKRMTVVELEAGLRWLFEETYTRRETEARLQSFVAQRRDARLAARRAAQGAGSRSL